VPHILRRVRSRKSGFEVGSAGRVRAGRDVVVVKVRREDEVDRCWQKRQMLAGRVDLAALRCSARRGRVDKCRIAGWM